VHITSALPTRAHALPFADRIEVRFGKAFPVVLAVDCKSQRVATGYRLPVTPRLRKVVDGRQACATTAEDVDRGDLSGPATVGDWARTVDVVGNGRR
jgi:hypothetical protein